MAHQELKRLVKGRDIYTQTEYGQNYWNAYTKMYVVKNNQLINITWMAAEALGVTLKKDGRVPYGDFDSVYNLGRRLWPKGHKCDGDKCHSNDHVNRGDTENTFHRDGGYRLKQRSL